MTHAIDASAFYPGDGFALARQRLAERDAQTSDDLARRLNTRSWREAHANDPTGFCRCGCGVRVESGQAFVSATCRARYAQREAEAGKRCLCGSAGPLNKQRRCAKCVQEHAIASRWETMGIKPLHPGDRFGSRVVVRLSPTRSADQKVMYQVRCDCGRLDVVMGAALRRGKASACRRCAMAVRDARRAG